MAITLNFCRRATIKSIPLGISLLLGLLILLLAPVSSAAGTAYLHPALLQTESQTMPVIVTGIEPAAAARAVEAVNGQITSHLWLIDAVGATLSTSQVKALIASPEIVSVVPNGAVRTAEAPGDGYMSERRRIKGVHQLADEQVVPAVPLPDGGAVSVAKKGSLLILNDDGSRRVEVPLPDGNYKTSPVVGLEGTIYLAREEKAIYAINPDGSLRWQFDNAFEKFNAGVALSPDGTVVYGIDEKRRLYALDGEKGRLLWQIQVGSEDADKVEQAPTVGPEGTIYVVTTKGFVFAVKSDGKSAWSFQADQDERFYAPLVAGNGLIYVANHEKNVYAVSAVGGALEFSFQTKDKILASPTLAGDGTLYVADEKLHLYALNSNGSERFVFTADEGDKFATSPAISADGETVYVAAEKGTIFAVDATSGVEQWRYRVQGEIEGDPIVDRWGNMVAGSEQNELVFLAPEGEVVAAMNLSGKVQQAPGTNGEGDLIVRLDADKVATVGRLASEWNGQPDVAPTDDPMVWKFQAPAAIDVGADVLHDEVLQNGNAITGKDVGVALVDSGVYFDDEVKKVLGSAVEELFLGQADFVGEGICEEVSGGSVQHLGYCWTNHEVSKDRYGHGSHIAGIIWNHFIDDATGTKLGVAPDANILSVRVLGDDGIGTYEDVIEGIQFVLTRKDEFNIRVLNLSLSGHATTPYFADPLNRAAEAAWAEGLVVVAAAGNSGPSAESITVPGSDPYVITVGAVDTQRTAGYWGDDLLPTWSAAGPTRDGFVKPDVLAPGSNVVSFMYNDPDDMSNSAYLVQQHPDYSETSSLFRMNGTSMSSAITSGVVALMLEKNPALTPDQVKYRLIYSAGMALTEDDEPIFSPLQQGAGRIWAPDAVLSPEIPDGSANKGMDIEADLAHPWHEGDSLDPANNPDLDFHYLGPVQRLVSDDGQAYLYFVQDPADGTVDPLGIATVGDLNWLDGQSLNELKLTFNDGELSWNQDYLWTGGRYSWSGGRYSWSGSRYSWSGGRYSWSGGRYSWSGGRYSWSGGRYSWSGGRYSWSGGRYSWSGGRYSWSGETIDPGLGNLLVTNWIESGEDS